MLCRVDIHCAASEDTKSFFVYSILQANPPQLHSNLKFIQLYRRQAKLVSEAAYYLTNLVSAKTFISELNAKSLSIDQIEFEESMQAARVNSKEAQKEATPNLKEMTISQDHEDPGALLRSHDSEIRGKFQTRKFFIS